MGDLFFSGLISELQIRKSDSLTSSFDLIKKKKSITVVLYLPY